MVVWLVLLVDLGDDGIIWSPGSVCCLTERIGKVGIGIELTNLELAELVDGDAVLGLCC